jgi:flagella basal body P-ring formation protein FlgA
MNRLTAAFASALAATSALAAQPVTLKANPVDADGTITLAEVFDGTRSEAVVGAGPQPGAAVVLDAGRLQTAARAAGLAWANPAGVRRVVVRSASSAGVPPGSGVGHHEVLTYSRSLNAGEMVAAEDLTWAAAPRGPVDAPGDAEAVIGLQLRKPVRAGTAVAARDLGAAWVIAKNDPVTVQYRAGRVSLTLQGKAMGAAAVGEPVRVVNVSSKTVVEAVAVGPGRAVVGPAAETLRQRGSDAYASR